MPVTFPVSPELQTAGWQARPAYLGPRPGDTLQDAAMVTAACDKAAGSFKVLQGSVAPNEYASLVPQSNGFVQAVVQAYGTHSHLRIRPDDVWIAILSQLSFYVNAHAEELREYFVSHDGQQSLYVELTGDYGELARKFVVEMEKHISDNTLSEWILPDFTTTTLKDYTVCSVLMMATCKAYFKFYGGITCGFPSVTLEGTKEDWQRLLYRTHRLYEFGDQPAVWAEMLRPILSRFVAAFDGNPGVPFWKHAVHRIEEYCGQDDLTGWITAFCVWTTKGEWKAGALPQNIPVAPSFTEPPPPPPARSALELPPEKPEDDSSSKRSRGSMSFRMKDRATKLLRRGSRVLSIRKEKPSSIRRATTSENTVEDATTASTTGTVDDTKTMDEAKPGSGSVLERHESWDWRYTLDGVSYFTIRFDDIPDGYGEVDVTIDDDGKEIPCLMVAGNLAFSVTESTPGGKLDTVSPSPQWYMLQKVDAKRGIRSLRL
ncbi:hypothetical protein GY45DRAFT_1329621 [Cubamyces sp. BRFM 1775]|nr:hypothetical protein GY45DRAFT_1329621 [Cubamyces sp. BRFM 1775]